MSQDNGASRIGSFVRWAAQHAIPLDGFAPELADDDLHPLASLLAPSRVVAIGESTHRVREQFFLRYRLSWWLFERHGFGALAIEDSLSCGKAWDRYVRLGRGSVDDALAAASLPSVWDTVETRQMLRRLRDLNLERPPDRRVGVFGLDIAAPGAELRHAQALIGASKRPDVADGILAKADFGLWHADWAVTVAAYRAAPAEALKGLGQRLRVYVQRVEQACGADEGLAWALRHAKAALWAHEMFVDFTADRFNPGAQRRDDAMADQMLWLCAHATPQRGMVVWAGNGHICRAPRQITMAPFEGPFRPTGKTVSKALKDAYCAVGSTFARTVEPNEDGVLQKTAAEPNSLDALLDKVGPDFFALDLRPLAQDPKAAEALETPRPMRCMDGYEPTRPRDAFDALLFVRDTGTTTPFEQELTAGAQAQTQG